MKTILKLILIFSFFTSQAFGISLCETTVREASSLNIIRRIEWKNFLSKTPTPPNWLKVHDILRTKSLGKMDTETWMLDFIKRQKLNQTTYEEQLAAIAILSPERGLPLLSRAEAQNNIRFRQLIFGQTQWPVGNAVGNMIFPLNLVSKRWSNTIGLPKNVKDVEATFMKVASGFIREPSLFSPLKKEGFKFWKYQRAFIDEKKLVDARKAEILEIYKEFRKFLDQPASFENFRIYYAKNFGRDFESAREAGLINPVSSMEETIAGLRVKLGEERTDLYVWQAAKALVGLTFMTAISASVYFPKQSTELLRGLLERQDPDEIRKKIKDKKQESEFKVISELMDVLYTEALRVTLENEYPDLIQLPFDPSDPKLLNPGTTDEYKYPCDPYGAVYRSVHNSEQSGVPLDLADARARMTSNIVGGETEFVRNSCQFAVRLQLYKKKLDEEKAQRIKGLKDISK